MFIDMQACNLQISAYWLHWKAKVRSCQTMAVFMWLKKRLVTKICAISKGANKHAAFVGYAEGKCLLIHFTPLVASSNSLIFCCCGSREACSDLWESLFLSRGEHGQDCQWAKLSRWKIKCQAREHHLEPQDNNCFVSVCNIQELVYHVSLKQGGLSSFLKCNFQMSELQNINIF